jgi:2-iminobutanoate/2-iminopropanoate deaminase
MPQSKIRRGSFLKTFKAVLAADELIMDNIVSTTVFLKNMNEFTKMNDVYA